jgi:hypothetical protein
MTHADVDSIISAFFPGMGILSGIIAALGIRTFWNWGGDPLPISRQDAIDRAGILLFVLIMRTVAVLIGLSLVRFGWYAWPSGLTETRLSDVTIGMLLWAVGSVVAYLFGGRVLIEAIIESAEANLRHGPMKDVWRAGP